MASVVKVTWHTEIEYTALIPVDSEHEDITAALTDHRIMSLILSTREDQRRHDLPIVLRRKVIKISNPKEPALAIATT